MKDQIKREIEINANREKVFEAISNPEQVTKWFPETIEGKYEVGHQPIFGFGENGRTQIMVVESNPYDYFAFRWVPGANQYLGDLNKVKNTLVEFHLEALSDTLCKVVLTESGFSNLSEDIGNKAFEQNSGGWTFMLGRLQKFFN